MTCKVDDCVSTAVKREMCDKHYRRVRKHGDPSIVLPRTAPRIPKPCIVDGCPSEALWRGCCRPHYRRLMQHGDPTLGSSPRPWGPLEHRLMIRVDKTDTCWLWTGYCMDDGYGVIGVPGGGTDLVHRVAYRLFVGPIPDGLEIDHVWARGCTHRNCVNPVHLEPVTHTENVRRATERRANQGELSCR